MFRQAIETKYYGPTNHKGSRIRVKAEAGTQWFSWDYSKEVSENHAICANMFANDLGWLEHSKLIGGGTQTGYVFVMVDND